MKGQNFALHSAARIIGPDALQVTQLMVAMRLGHSLMTMRAAPVLRSFPSDEGQFVLCQTSGSTASPKVIRRRAASWIASFEQNATMFDISPEDVLACFGDLGHSLTLYAALEALHLGAGLVHVQARAPEIQHGLVADTAARILYATPTQLRVLLKGARSLLPRVRLILCGGGKLEASLRAELGQICPRAEIVEFFGASETSFVTLARSDAPEGSVGRPYPGVRLRIGSRAGGAAPGETGEIWVQSPYLFDGYAEGTSEDTRWEDGWLSIGEMGYLDALGHVFLRGRKSGMVTIADHNVFPEDIETIVGQIPGVEACAVVAVPDPMRGHRLGLFVQGPREIDAAQIRSVIRRQLGAAAVPRNIRPIARLPLLAAGKPDRVALRLLLKDMP